MTDSLRVLTYNIRKGKGANGRSKVPMSELGHALSLSIKDSPLDLVLCQEVFHSRTGDSQSGHLAKALGFESYYGANKFREIGNHGNTTLTRMRVMHFQNHDISTNRIEKRGALYVRVSLAPKRPLHVFNVHLGLNQWQRIEQIDKVGKIMAEQCKAGEPVLLAGDFNDWRGKLDNVIVGQLGFHNVFKDHDARSIRTWHSRRPMFNLDRIYVRNLSAKRAQCLSGEPWTELSDHLPLWAELSPSP